MSHELKPWRTLATKEILAVKGRFTVSVETVEMANGRVIDDYWQIRMRDYVKIVASTPSGEVLCLRQYMHGARRLGLTLPGGLIEDTEDPQEAARRELLEETGYRAEAWQATGIYVTSGSQGGSHAHCFYAENSSPFAIPHSGDLEDSEVVILSREAIRRAFEDNVFLVASDLAALATVFIGGVGNSYYCK